MKILLVLVPVVLTAAPIGNPSLPMEIHEGFYIPSSSCTSSRIGYEGDFVSNARMNENSDPVDEYRQITNSGTVTINFIDRIDLYSTLGSSRTYATWRFTTPKGKTNRMELETIYRFLWAVGGRCVLYEWGNAILGCGGRYSRTDTPLAWTTINGAPISTSGSHLRWEQWQVNLLLSYKIDIFIPYLGINYLNGKTEVGPFQTAITQNEKSSLHMKNRSSIGLVIGCSLTSGKDFFLNIEGRLIDEEAFDISGEIKF